MPELTADTYANLSTCAVVFSLALIVFVIGAALTQIGAAIKGFFDD